LAVILDAYNVQESSQQKVQLEIKTDERKGHEQTEVVTVSKANVKWKRELLRGDLPELANKELMELNRDSGVDLLKLMKEKEDKKDEKKESAAMSQLHATLYGATFVAKMTKAIADGNRKTSAGAETPNVQNTEKQENVSNTTSLTESQNTEKQENVSNTTSLTGSQNTEKQEDNTTPLTESQNTEKQENVSNTTESQKSKEPSKFALRIRNAIQNKSKSGSSESSADSETSTEKKDKEN